VAEDVVRLERNGLAIDVSPLGGAILAAHWCGIPILAPTPSPGLASKTFGVEACFPLVPFGNRIEGNAFRFAGEAHTLAPNTADPLVLHGHGWLRRWSILQQGPHGIVFHDRHAAGSASPFAYEATQAITLGDDSLTLSLTVTNRAPQALPYGLGFHPYFPRTAKMRLVARAERFRPERESHLPGAAGPLPRDLDLAAGTTLPDRWLNNAFDGWDGRARIEWPETGLILSLEAGEGLRHFVIYSPSASHGFVCFEPMSHRPNAHHDDESGGLVALAPGGELAGRMTLRLAQAGRPTSL
jgi:aldose 1-epimerase